MNRKILKTIIVINTLALFIFPNICFGFKDKLESKPTYWGNKNFSDVGGLGIMTIMENSDGKSAFFNGEEVLTPKGKRVIENHCSSTYEALLWVNKYTHTKGVDYTDLGMGDGVFGVVKDAIYVFLSKEQINKVMENVRYYYLEAGVNKYDTDATGDSGLDSDGDERMYLYENVTLKNLSAVAKQSVESIQEMRAAKGDAKLAGKTTEQTQYEASDGKTIDFIDSLETKKNYTKAQVEKYIEMYGVRLGVSGQDRNDLLAQWASTFQGSFVSNVNKAEEILNALNETKKIQEIQKITGYTIAELDEISAEYASMVTDKETVDPDAETVFLQPRRAEAKDATEDVITDADKFLDESGEVGEYVDETQLQHFSQTLYSILLGIGVAIAVIVGMIIGIKLMVAPVSERAEAKKMLVPYVVGCIVVFGAFGIWRLAVTIMQGF